MGTIGDRDADAVGGIFSPQTLNRIMRRGLEGPLELLQEQLQQPLYNAP